MKHIHLRLIGFIICFFMVGAVKVGYDDVNVRIAISNEYTKMWNQAADKREHYTVLRTPAP